MSERAAGHDAAWTVVDHVRLFRNWPDIRWKYRVHEQILPALRATAPKSSSTDIVIHTPVMWTRLHSAKLERNLRLLHLDHVDQSRRPYILFHLGVGPLGMNRVPEAIAFLQASLNGSQLATPSSRNCSPFCPATTDSGNETKPWPPAVRGEHATPKTRATLPRRHLPARTQNWPAAERSFGH